MKKIKLKFLMALLIGASLVSCGKESTTVNNNTTSGDSDSSTGTSTGTGTSGSCAAGRTGEEEGISTDGQSINYYTIPYHDVIMHGATAGNVVFNTQLDLSGYNENIFKTDGRFNLRVIPRQIGKGTDSRGNTCTKQKAAQEFSMMNVGIRVRASNASTGYFNLFRDIPVDCASEVHEFEIPVTSYPLVIEVLDVTNDQDCLEDQSRGITSGRNCPYTEVGSMECFALEIQFSTDNTKDIPHQNLYKIKYLYKKGPIEMDLFFYKARQANISHVHS